jgi:hypothetical protein
MDVPQKYGLLRAVAFILKLIAWIILIAAIIGGFVLMLNLGSGLGTWSGLGVMAVGVVTFLEVYAVGSILSVLVDIERDTRAAALSSRS